ncbi:uncharacterized protein LOC143462550 isoform X1 [Clavelina lepadiformis]|uniref:Uncharacterized protein n=1 Tax=Clavelina lepadiformis TaxID=159417 RepID=A0ABP0FVZ2_CLALP
MERIAIISVGLVVWMNGIGFYLAAMLTDFWMVAESDRSGGSVGLFKSCGPNPNDAFCNNQSWDPNEITLTIFLPRIIMLLAGGLLGIGMVSGLFGLLSRKHAFFVGERVLDVFAGLLIFVACGAFTGLHIKDVTKGGPFFIYTYHFSFYMAWISGIMLVISGVIGVFARNQDTD